MILKFQSSLILRAHIIYVFYNNIALPGSIFAGEILFRLGGQGCLGPCRGSEKIPKVPRFHLGTFFT